MRYPKIESILLVTALILVVFPLSCSEGFIPLQEQFTRSRSTIIVNASGGGDHTHIQWAIDNASEGDTVYVEAGVYRENIVLNKSINLIGELENRPTIDRGEEGGIVSILADWVTISGFTIENNFWESSSADPWVFKGIKIDNASYCNVENNKLMNYGGIALCNSSNINITNNKIYSFRQSIFLDKGNNNCVFDNTCQSYLSNGIHVYKSNNSKISNNILLNSLKYGIYISFDSYGNVIYHNNFLNNNNKRIQAYDAAAINIWNGTEGRGNYWSDYGSRYPNATNDSVVWNGNYSIDTHGFTSACIDDFFPLCDPVGIENRSPVANAGPDINIQQHRTVTFNGSNSFHYNGISNFTWNFRYNHTNITLHGPTPMFTFHEMGKYNITLIVTNTKGYQDNDQMSVLVLDGEPPIAECGPDAVIDQGVMFVFNASGSRDNVGISQYRWNFTYNNTNITLYCPAPSFTFDIPGVYNITLWVGDAMANFAYDNMLLTVLYVELKNYIVVDVLGNGDYTRILDGIRNVGSGGTVYVMEGTYREKLVINKSVNLVGAGFGNTTIDGCDIGDTIRIEADRVNVSGFTITNASDDALEVNHSNHLRIENNRFVENNFGLWINHSCNATITNNLFFGNGIVFRGDLIEHWVSHSIDRTNLVNDRPVIYWKNIIANGEKVPAGAGQIILANCSGIIVENQVINNTDTAIAVAFSDKNTILNNLCENNEDGIYIHSSDENYLCNNTCNDNNRTGINFHHYCNNNTITNNSCFNNKLPGIFLGDSTNNVIINNECNSKEIEVIYDRWSKNTGILIVNSSKNLIEKNICENNKFGIVIYRSSNNIITSNVCRMNMRDGLEIVQSSKNNITKNLFENNNDNGIGYYSKSSNTSIQCDGNNITNNVFISNINYSIHLDGGSFNTTIYHNDFIDNNNNNNGRWQAYDDGKRNQWNISNSGNYWSDKTSPDNDGDGIVDNKYRIDGHVFSYDYFPLTKPFNPTRPVADAGPDIIIDENNTVHFNAANSTDDVGIVNYTWDFYHNGTNVELYGPDPNFTFKEPGIYDVRLTVTDDEGNIAFDYIRITVNPIMDEHPPDDDDENNTRRVAKDREYFILFGIGIVVMITVLVCVIVGWMKKRKKRMGGRTQDIEGKEEKYDEYNIAETGDPTRRDHD